MSMMDKLKNMLKGHPDQTNQGIDRAGDSVDDKTQGKHRRHVDTAQDKMRDQYGGGGTGGTERRDEPPQQ
ncbi:antitoxin [Streptomyces peucetius]|uniref:Antitoxin n=1 Tax=Streptomyces peucetius TaxID=1950 RepID=A0ABY6I715_STRPE|nr:antitoxin [Streptomyces peucetius]UYQ61762.1 antitoxin [Streptomyces peucetius]